MLADVSIWADEIRPQRPETAPWHFGDIPIHPPAGTPAAYDAARDCPQGDCVVAAIERFAAVLRDNDAAPRRRLEALKWVVHLIADIHQPLHAADLTHGGQFPRSLPGCSKASGPWCGACFSPAVLTAALQ